MKLGILSRSRNLYSTQRLVEAARRRRHDVHVIDPFACALQIASEGNRITYRGIRLDRFDYLVPRIGASATFFGQAFLEVFSEELAVPSLNPPQGIVQSHDKFLSLQHLAGRGLPVPRTVLIRQPELLDEALEAIGDVPVIVKLLQGSQGVGVMKADSRATLRGMLDAMWSLRQTVILQEFVAEAGGADIRAMVLGGRVVAAIRRQAAVAGEFRSNLHRGGTAVPLQLDDEHADLACRAAQAFGLGLAGVDILTSERGPLIVEINSSPGLEGIESATGRDLARMIVVHAERFV